MSGHEPPSFVDTLFAHKSYRPGFEPDAFEQLSLAHQMLERGLLVRAVQTVKTQDKNTKETQQHQKQGVSAADTFKVEHGDL